LLSEGLPSLVLGSSSLPVKSKVFLVEAKPTSNDRSMPQAQGKASEEGRRLGCLVAEFDGRLRPNLTVGA
jgi:hypothetical protein